MGVDVLTDIGSRQVQVQHYEILSRSRIAVTSTRSCAVSGESLFYADRRKATD